MHLPPSHNLSISKLAASFANTSATYKFYWLLGIVELVEEGNTTFLKRKLFARMIGNAWYTVNYFHVSFGKQDLIQQAVQALLENEKTDNRLQKRNVVSSLGKFFIKIHATHIVSF